MSVDNFSFCRQEGLPNGAEIEKHAHLHEKKIFDSIPLWILDGDNFSIHNFYCCFEKHGRHFMSEWLYFHFGISVSMLISFVITIYSTVPNCRIGTAIYLDAKFHPIRSY